MKSNEELQVLYDTKLKPVLESLEKQRKKLKGRTILLIVVFLATFVFFGIDDSYDLTFFKILIPINLLLFGFLIYKFIKPLNAYKKEFKEKVVKEIVVLINPEWKYDAEGSISREEYNASKLFIKGVDKYEGDDMVTGTIEKTSFRMSDLHTQYKKTSSSGKKGKSETLHTIFRGLFAVIDFNKEIKGETLVLPDTAENLFGSFGTKLQSMSSRGKLIKLENIEFEQYFVVYGSDQIEARYILTPSIMEALVNIAQKYNKLFFMSFIGSKVYFALGFNEGLFEPRIFSTGVRFDDMVLMNDQFNTIQTIIHELKLNTRIWTKD
jgi:uncharacterized protein DUF3137